MDYYECSTLCDVCVYWGGGGREVSMEVCVCVFVYVCVY